MYIQIHTRIYIYIYYLSLSLYIYIYMHIHIYIHMYAYIICYMYTHVNTTEHWVALPVWRCSSNTVSFVSCPAFRVKGHRSLLHCSQHLKTPCVRQVVWDKRFPLMNNSQQHDRMVSHGATGLEVRRTSHTIFCSMTEGVLLLTRGMQLPSKVPHNFLLHDGKRDRKLRSIRSLASAEMQCATPSSAQ